MDFQWEKPTQQGKSLIGPVPPAFVMRKEGMQIHVKAHGALDLFLDGVVRYLSFHIVTGSPFSLPRVCQRHGYEN